MFEDRINEFKNKLLGIGFDINLFYGLNTVWKPSEREIYDTLSWSGYLEKLIEKGTGNHLKIPDAEGKNALGIVNGCSKKEAVFNCSNWNDINTSEFYKAFLPPAVLITNDRQLVAQNRSALESYSNLGGTLIICKRDKRANEETCIYSVGQNHVQTKRMLFRELFA